MELAWQRAKTRGHQGHQPRSGIFGDGFFGPEFERSHHGILGQFFCDADIVGDSGRQWRR